LDDTKNYIYANRLKISKTIFDNKKLNEKFKTKQQNVFGIFELKKDGLNINI